MTPSYDSPAKQKSRENFKQTIEETSRNFRKPSARFNLEGLLKEEKITINNLAREYHKCIDANMKAEIVFNKDDGSVKYDKRTDEQRKIANEIICLLHPQVSKLACELKQETKSVRSPYGRQALSLEGYPITEEALVSESAIEVMTALGQYNPSKNGLFTSYVACRILTRMNAAAIHNKHLIHTSSEVHSSTEGILEEKSRDEAIKEIAEMRWPHGTKHKYLKATHIYFGMDGRYTSIHQPTHYKEGICNIDEQESYDAGRFEDFYLEDEDAKRMTEEYAENKQLSEQMRRALKTLTPREEKVLRLRFGIDEEYTHTLEEIGQDVQVTNERIRQNEAKALRKLRHSSRSKHLKGFLD